MTTPKDICLLNYVASSPVSLADAGLSREQATALIVQFYQDFPQVSDFAKRAAQSWEENQDKMITLITLDSMTVVYDETGEERGQR